MEKKHEEERVSVWKAVSKKYKSTAPRRLLIRGSQREEDGEEDTTQREYRRRNAISRKASRECLSPEAGRAILLQRTKSQLSLAVSDSDLPPAERERRVSFSIELPNASEKYIEPALARPEFPEDISANSDSKELDKSKLDLKELSREDIVGHPQLEILLLQVLVEMTTIDLNCAIDCALFLMNLVP